MRLKNNNYQLYGLSLKTTANIPHLAVIEESKKIDTVISFQETLTKNIYFSRYDLTEIYTSFGLAANKLPYLTVWKQFQNESEFLIIRYNNGANITFFVSNKKGTQLKVLYHSTVALGDVYTYLLGPVIGCILRLKNKVCLHASVVNINQQAIAFIGEKTAGKSTLIAKFATKGYPVLSDDIAVLFQENNIFKVNTGYPRLRLWRKSLTQIKDININTLAPVLGHIDKYYLPLNGSENAAWQFQKEPLPLAGVIYLNGRNEINYLALNKLSSIKGFLKLKQNIYAAYMLDTALLKKEFEVFGQISQQLPILSLERPDNLDALEDTSKLIVDWVENNSMVSPIY